VDQGSGDVMSELDKIKVGDVVAMSLPGRGWKKIKVDKITKTQVIIGISKFRKIDGERVGRIDKWQGSQYLRCLTPEIEEEIEENKKEAERKNLIYKIQHVDLTAFPLERLEEIIKIIG